MAWIKDVVLPNGVHATCWEIDVLHFKRGVGTECVYLGWVDKAAMDQGLEPVVQESVSVPIGANPQLGSAVLSYAEQKIRAQEKFEDSEDA